MSKYFGGKQTIMDIIGEDGPIMKEMRKPQIMFVPHKGFSSWSKNRDAMKEVRKQQHRQRMKKQYGI